MGDAATIRIRTLSIATAVVVVIGLAGGAALLLRGGGDDRADVPAAAADPAAKLLELVAQGKITGDQAVQLARLLEARAFPPAADETDEPPSTVEPNPFGAPRIEAHAEEEAARATFQDAVSQLLQTPDPAVRQAVVDLADPAARASATAALMAFAEAGGSAAATIWRALGAVLTLDGAPEARVALARARNANPQDKRVWRLLSAAYAREANPREAAGAAFVAHALDAASQGRRDEAEVTLVRALPLVAADQQAFLYGMLGDAAVARGEWGIAAERYRGAVEAELRDGDLAGLAVESAKLARTLVQQGARSDACRALSRAKDAGAAIAASDLAAACDEGAPVNLAPRP